MSDEDKKVEEETKEPTEELKNEETKEQAPEQPTEETDSNVLTDVTPDGEAKATEGNDAGNGVIPDAAEDTTSDEEPKEEPKPSASAEATADKEPPSPIAREMQDTTGHKGKMIGAEEVKPGMTIRVHERIVDITPKGDKRERTQVFEGIILGIKGAGNKKTMTVRKISKGGYGVEKVFPLASPNVQKIEVVKMAKVRRAKLTFLKNLKRRFKRKLKEDWIDRK